MFRQLKAENQVFEGMFARHPTIALFAVDGGPEPVNTEIVSGSYFGVLGVRAALGRLLDESDDVTPGGHPVVALSYDYWKTKLGGRTDIVGRKVLLNNYPMTVLGVAAEGFRDVDFGELPAVFVPTMMKKEATPDFDWLDDPRSALTPRCPSSACAPSTTSSTARSRTRDCSRSWPRPSPARPSSSRSSASTA